MASDKHEHVVRPRKHIFLNNFLGGLAWGLGVTVGLSVIFVVLAVLGRYVDLVPVVGDFVAKVINFILQNEPHLVR